MNTAEHIAQLRKCAETSRVEAAKQRKDAARYQAKADLAVDAADSAEELARGWDEIADLLAGAEAEEAQHDRMVAEDDARTAAAAALEPAGEDEGQALDTAAAARVHYTDPRVRRLAEARYRLETGGTHQDWLMLGKNNPEALIEQARDWTRAAVAAGILPSPGDPFAEQHANAAALEQALAEELAEDDPVPADVLANLHAVFTGPVEGRDYHVMPGRDDQPEVTW